MLADLPDHELEDEKCKNQWDISKSFITKFKAEITEWTTDSTNKKAEYNTALTELNTNIKLS